MPNPSSNYTTVNSLNLHPELAKTHRAIALDRPGYSLSDKPLDVT